MNYQDNNSDNDSVPPPSYQKCDKDETSAQLFLCTNSSISNLVQAVEFHSRNCSEDLIDSESCMRGSVNIMKLNCKAGHAFSWASSPHLPNGKFLANVRLVHSYLSSGILPNQFERLSDCIGFTYLDYVVKAISNDYKSVVNLETQSSCEDAIMEETSNSFDNEGSIDIMTDARHGYRKNAKDTNVMCLGQTTHKVLKDIHVTKDDDGCAQRHELLGKKRLYEYFDSRSPFISGPVYVRAHAHDRNASVNKYLRVERPEVVTQNDTWHAGKSIEKKINKIARGPKFQHGRTWHEKITKSYQ